MKAGFVAYPHETGKARQAGFLVQALIAIRDPAAKCGRISVQLGAQTRAQRELFAINALHQQGSRQPLPLTAPRLVPDDAGFGILERLEF